MSCKSCSVDDLLYYSKEISEASEGKTDNVRSIMLQTPNAIHYPMKNLSYFSVTLHVIKDASVM